MAKYYGIREQKEAQEYIKRRLENELSMDADIDGILASFTDMLMDILSEGATENELDTLAAYIADLLLEDCELLAVDDHTENRDGIIAYIGRKVGDMTLRERITERCRTFAGEVLVVYTLGMLLGKKREEIRESVVKNWDKPYDSPIIMEAKGRVLSGEMTSPVSLEPPHYGRGVTVSSSKALKDICRNALVEGWGWHDYTEHKDEAVGFVVQRGSSFPCDTCDSMVGYHDIDDTDFLPMFHNHCRCYVIWVYNREAL